MGCDDPPRQVYPAIVASQGMRGPKEVLARAEPLVESEEEAPHTHLVQPG